MHYGIWEMRCHSDNVLYLHFHTWHKNIILKVTVFIYIALINSIACLCLCTNVVEHAIMPCIILICMFCIWWLSRHCVNVCTYVCMYKNGSTGRRTACRWKKKQTIQAKPYLIRYRRVYEITSWSWRLLYKYLRNLVCSHIPTVVPKLSSFVP
jgi:hypothetical protein